MNKAKALEGLLAALIELKKAEEAEHAAVDLANAIDFTKVPNEGLVLVRVDPEVVCSYKAASLMRIITGKLALATGKLDATFLVVPNTLELEALPDDKLALIGLQRIPGFDPAAAAAATAH